MLINILLLQYKVMVHIVHVIYCITIQFPLKLFLSTVIETIPSAPEQLTRLNNTDTKVNY